MPRRESEWERIAREMHEQETASQLAGQRAAALNKAEEARIARIHADGMTLINQVVEEFRAAMRRAWNPGRTSFFDVLARDLSIRYHGNPQGSGERICSYWEETEGAGPGGYFKIVRVYSDGQWRYTSGTEGRVGAGPAGDVYGSSSTFTSESAPSAYMTPARYQAMANDFRRLLTRTLLRCGVKLPGNNPPDLKRRRL